MATQWLLVTVTTNIPSHYHHLPWYLLLLRVPLVYLFRLKTFCATIAAQFLQERDARHTPQAAHRERKHVQKRSAPTLLILVRWTWSPFFAARKRKEYVADNARRYGTVIESVNRFCIAHIVHIAGNSVLRTAISDW